jgi:hypothetical protein
MDNIQQWVDVVKTYFNNLGSNTLQWIGIIIGHCVFLPTALALLTGLSDITPSLDIVILVQAMLMTMFIRSIVVRDNIATVLHGLGWFGQSLLLAMVVFK